MNSLRQKPGNLKDHVSSNELYEQVSPRRSEYQVRSAHFYRKIDNGVGWNIANCVAVEDRVSIGMLFRVSKDLSSFRVIRPMTFSIFQGQDRLLTNERNVQGPIHVLRHLNGKVE